jgi:hypothetical protein
MAIGADGLPVMAYAEGSRGLKVVHCGDPSCSGENTLTTVDGASITATLGSSVAIGADGLPVIAYWSYPSYDLKVVHCGNASCSEGNVFNTVESPELDGSFPSITVGADALPIITHRTGGPNYAVKVVHCGDINCGAANAVTTLDSGWPNFSPIVVGADGLPLITYSDLSHRLKVAHCNTPTCAQPVANTDTDLDGCRDSVELGPNPSLGGQRDPGSFWDFIDQWANDQRDRRVNIIDIGAVVRRSGTNDGQANAENDRSDNPLDAPKTMNQYHSSADRSAPIGPNPWNLGLPDGRINVIDLGAVVAQSGHTCM